MTKQLPLLAIVLFCGVVSGSIRPASKCFIQMPEQRRSGVSIHGVADVGDVVNCEVHCLHAGQPLCMGFSYDAETKNCHLFNSTAAVALLHPDSRFDYYEFNQICSTTEARRAFAHAKRLMDSDPGLKAQWSEWSLCKSNCEQHRYLQCERCFKEATQVRTCSGCLKRYERGVDSADEWSDWGDCSTTCGPGLMTRSRAGETETQACTKMPCPFWQDWSAWNDCSATCDGGSRKRFRKCSFYYGCEGATMENGQCNEMACCEPWKDWSQCSVTCGIGERSHDRRCVTEVYDGQAINYNDENTIEQCDTGVPCAGWTTWGDWSDCNKECDGGVRFRLRECSAYGCPGVKQESESCNTDPCASWNEWNRWAVCSATCGGGIRSRQRTCGAHGQCDGLAVDDEDCNKNACPNWLEWGDWNFCTATCGGGVKKRQRVCNQYNLCEGYPAGQFNQLPCNEHSCPDWTHWQDWADCSAPCNGGVRMRDRVCQMDPGYCDANMLGTASCSCPGKQDNRELCNNHDCAEWSTWEKWNTCSASCGDSGVQTRKRTCRNNALFCAGVNEDHASCKCVGDNDAETQGCNTIRCPEWSEWNDWGVCSTTCGGGKMERRRTCQIDDNFCVGRNRNLDECKCSGLDHENKDCNGQVCPEWSVWGAWQECTATCNGGQMNRKRMCRNDQTFCGANAQDPKCVCAGQPDDSDACNLHKCPFWEEWEGWADCSASCDGGSQSRVRQCDFDQAFCTPDKMGTDLACACLGKDDEDQNCNEHQCPDAGQWTEWSQCSKSCKVTNTAPPGTRERTRECSNDPVFCAANPGHVTCRCDADLRDKELCNDFPCPKWSNWASWTECTAKCGGGVSSRARKCLFHIGHCVNEALTTPACMCDGKTEDGEEQTCNAQSCAAWSEWSPWTDCSKTCGGGNRERVRVCQKDDTFCAANPNHQDCICPGNDQEKENCNLQNCPSWEPWSVWTRCTRTCGGGIRDRKRDCLTDADFCVADKQTTPACTCNGEPTFQESCHDEPCAMWTDWESWSTCTSVCGGGSRNRARKCPEDGKCGALNEETSICNMEPCPDWGEWGPYSDCSKSCDGGQRVRTRTCPMLDACSPGDAYVIDPVPCNAIPCPVWMEWGSWMACSATCNQGVKTRLRDCKPAGCVGSTEELAACEALPCPMDTFWSAWSPCTKTCGGGKQVRSKFTCSTPVTCPTPVVEDQPCNDQLCPEWTAWEPWGQCSKPCGSGSQTRRRVCPVVNGCVGEAVQTHQDPCNTSTC